MCFWPPFSWSHWVLQKEPPGFFYTKLSLALSRGVSIYFAFEWFFYLRLSSSVILGFLPFNVWALLGIGSRFWLPIGPGYIRTIGGSLAVDLSTPWRVYTCIH
jgi:hypothetical protein